jgi:hypothetical protein
VSTVFEAQAKKIAARPEVAAVGFDPITILMILSTVLPMLAQCFQKSDEPDPAKVAARVREMQQTHPKRLRARTMVAVKREAKAKGNRMTNEQAYIVADGIIAQTLETPDDTVQMCCSAAMAA